MCVCWLGVPPPGPSVMVMQLSVPNGPQPTQNPPMVQWNPCKYYSVEQRPSKPEPQVLHMHLSLYVSEMFYNFCTVRYAKQRVLIGTIYLSETLFL